MFGLSGLTTGIFNMTDQEYQELVREDYEQERLKCERRKKLRKSRKDNK